MGISPTDFSKFPLEPYILWHPSWQNYTGEADNSDFYEKNMSLGHNCLKIVR